jgi:hypothetical protein
VCLESEGARFEDCHVHTIRGGPQERLVSEEWMAVAMAMVGTLGLGVSSEDPPAGDPSSPPAAFGFVGFLSLAAFLVILAAAVAYGTRLTTAQKRKSASGAKTAASVHGLQVCPYTSRP